MIYSDFYIASSITARVVAHDLAKRYDIYNIYKISELRRFEENALVMKWPCDKADAL